MRLVRKNFAKTHIFRKIFNLKTTQVSHSLMINFQILTLIWVGGVRGGEGCGAAISNSLQSSDIGKNSYWSICNFLISDHSLINKICHNSTTSNDIDMKLGSVAKLDKRNMTTSKKLAITSYQNLCFHCPFSLIYSQFGAIRKSDSGRMVCKL